VGSNKARRLRRRFKEIEKLVLEDSKILGYRAFKGDFDNHRPFFGTGIKRRQEMLKRYASLRKIAASAVKNHFKDSFSAGKRSESWRTRMLRKQMSTGQCDLCMVKVTRVKKGQVTHNWHRETLEHVLDHDLGGPLVKRDLAVLCGACNESLNILKGIETIVEGSDRKKKEAVYDFFIFKQVIILSQKAAARDFEGPYKKFWSIRFNVANKDHRKMVSALKLKSDREKQRDTVYWTLDCFNHPHCRHCGACHSTSCSHDKGHNIAYLFD